MAKNNRYMQGGELLEKVGNTVKKYSDGVLGFGQMLKDKYEQAWEEADNSPKGKKAKDKIYWESGKRD